MTVTESKKTYTIISQRSSVGDSLYYHHSINKSEQGLFTDKTEALCYLAEECASELSEAKGHVSECERNIKKVQKLIEAEKQK